MIDARNEFVFGASLTSIPGAYPKGDKWGYAQELPFDLTDHPDRPPLWDKLFEAVDAAVYKRDHSMPPDAPFAVSSIIRGALEEVLALGHWNAERYKDVADKLKVDTPRLRELTKGRVGLLVAGAVIPTEIAEWLDEVPHRCRTFRPMDVFAVTRLGVTGLSLRGDLDKYDHRIYIANMYDDTTDLSGVGERFERLGVWADVTTALIGEQRGFSFADPGKPPLRWLDQALIAHSGIVTAGKALHRPEVISPIKRADVHPSAQPASSTYDGERELIGLSQIEVELLYKALAEKPDEKHRRMVEKMLGALFRKAYPHNNTDPLYAFSDAYNRLTSDEQRELLASNIRGIQEAA